MKAIYLAITAAAAALLLSACQRNELGGGSLSGEEVTVGISAVMPLDGGAVVKSDAEPGKGDEVNRCIMQVYLADDAVLSNATKVGEPKTVEVTDRKASFGSLQLVAGHTYRLVLWADCATKTSGTDGATASFSDLYYNTGNYPEVSFKDGVEYAGNDDSRDAFFASYELKVDGPSNRTVELHRPFGQLNIITSDYSVVETSFPALVPEKVSLTFSKVPQGINLLTGALAETFVKHLTGVSVVVADVTEPAAASGSKQLSFDYIFAPEGEEYSIPEITMSFDAEGKEVASDYKFVNLPVQRNYRTNVSGALLTDRAGVDVKVEPGFDGDEEVISSVDRLMNALENGGRVMLAQDMEIDRSSEESTGPDDDPNRIVVEKDVEIDLNGHKLTLKGESRMAANNAEIKISNGNIESESQSAEIFRFFANEGGKVVVEDVVMNVSGTTGVGFNPGANNARLEVRNSTIVAGKYAVGTNAAKPVSGAEIVIENSTLKAQTPILVNINANTKITNCTFEGTVQGGLFRGGQYEVTGSTFILKSSTEQSGETYLDKNWADGNKVPGAALVVGNRTSDAYQYPSNLKLINTKAEVEVIGQGVNLFASMYVWANENPDYGVTITYDDRTEFVGGKVIYGNDGKNIIVNGKPASELTE